MPLLDIRIKGKNLVGKFIADVVLQVLSFVAENDWSTRTIFSAKADNRFFS